MKRAFSAINESNGVDGVESELTKRRRIDSNTNNTNYININQNGESDESQLLSNSGASSSEKKNVENKEKSLLGITNVCDEFRRKYLELECLIHQNVVRIAESISNAQHFNLLHNEMMVQMECITATNAQILNEEMKNKDLVSNGLNKN